MEIPILLGSRPSIANPGIWVPIRFDRWFVRVEGLVDSKLTLHSNGPVKNKVKIILPTMNGATYNGPCQVRVEFVERGSEKNVSVFVVEHE
ncbi:hypothetical protein LCGC14_2383710 [marine sediment metagenome]|uniref:Uncharacterized protein n=1 Tax=marine sediment metagenome TaxID=412755 RepID=A0A0F9EUT9_9ZZZZ